MLVAELVEIAGRDGADGGAEARPALSPVTVVDLDRTLTIRGTYSPFLLFAARRRRRWRLALVPGVLLMMGAYKLGLIGRSRLKELMLRAMLGRSIAADEMDALASAYADHVVATNLCAGVRRLIAGEQAEGRLVILATAAHRFYAEPIARRLGIAEVVATESERDGDRLLFRIRDENLYGPPKARALAVRLADLGLRRDGLRVRCYSDDLSDLPLFAASDEPIAVNPSPALLRHAVAAGWPVIRVR